MFKKILNWFKNRNVTHTTGFYKKGNVIDYITKDVVADWINSRFQTPTSLIHGCNTNHDMSGGIARYISSKYKGAKEADDNVLSPKPTKYSIHKQAPNKYIVNAYTQANGGGINSGKTIDGTFYSDSKYARLSYIKGALENIKKYTRPGVLYFPQLGAGIAGGDWSEIREVIISVFKDTEFTVYLSYMENEWSTERFDEFVTNN